MSLYEILECSKNIDIDTIDYVLDAIDSAFKRIDFEEYNIDIENMSKDMSCTSHRIEIFIKLPALTDFTMCDISCMNNLVNLMEKIRNKIQSIIDRNIIKDFEVYCNGLTADSLNILLLFEIYE